jgi:arsenate reductase
MHHKLYPEIKATINSFDSSSISNERKQTLQLFIDFVQAKKNTNEAIQLNFICTHNSRRSHLSQIWAQTIATYFNIENITFYSGGTEATAVYPMVIETLKNSGFQITSNGKEDNPIYNVKYAENQLGVVAFSKKYDDVFNPNSNFAAVMTCSHADENCPFIAGAEKRIPLTFKDPKAFDNTPQQIEKYNERSLQIAAELFFVFSMIK